MEHPNAELHRRLTEAFQSADIETLKAGLAPDLGWYEAATPRSWA